MHAMQGAGVRPLYNKIPTTRQVDTLLVQEAGGHGLSRYCWRIFIVVYYGKGGSADEGSLQIRIDGKSPSNHLQG